MPTSFLGAVTVDELGAVQYVFALSLSGLPHVIREIGADVGPHQRWNTEDGHEPNLHPSVRQALGTVYRLPPAEAFTLRGRALLNRACQGHGAAGPDTAKLSVHVRIASADTPTPPWHLPLLPDKGGSHFPRLGATLPDDLRPFGGPSQLPRQQQQPTPRGNPRRGTSTGP